MMVSVGLLFGAEITRHNSHKFIGGIVAQNRINGYATKSRDHVQQQENANVV